MFIKLAILFFASFLAYFLCYSKNLFIVGDVIKEIGIGNSSYVLQLMDMERKHIFLHCFDENKITIIADLPDRKNFLWIEKSILGKVKIHVHDEKEIKVRSRFAYDDLLSTKYIYEQIEREM